MESRVCSAHIGIRQGKMVLERLCELASPPLRVRTVRYSTAGLCFAGARSTLHFVFRVRGAYYPLEAI